VLASKENSARLFAEKLFTINSSVFLEKERRNGILRASRHSAGGWENFKVSFFSGLRRFSL